MTYTRLEKNGIVAFTDGTRTKKVASEQACRERLERLLNDTQGDKQHQIVRDFWLQRSKDLTAEDELTRACASEMFLRLDKVWDELTAVPATLPENDVFAGFGL